MQITIHLTKTTTKEHLKKLNRSTNKITVGKKATSN